MLAVSENASVAKSHAMASSAALDPIQLNNRNRKANKAIEFYHVLSYGADGATQEMGFRCRW